MTKPLRLTPLKEAASNPELDNFAERFDERSTGFDDLIEVIRTELRAQTRWMIFMLVGTAVISWFLLMIIFRLQTQT